MSVKINPLAKGATSAKGHTTKQAVKYGSGGAAMSVPGDEPTIEYFDFLVDHLDPGHPTCNVNVNLGARIGLPDYSDVRFGASLTLPCAPREEDVETAYNFAKVWCMVKMEKLREELLDE